MTQFAARNIALAAGFCLAAANSANAAVSAEEARQLGTTLTPMGAEMAGNKEGTIPAWDASKTLRSPPPGYKPSSPTGTGMPYNDPFPEDKPLFSISAENMDKYADKLDPGAVFLLKNRPGYRMDVYATRRSIAHPDWVYENNKKCATTTKLLADGLSFEGAHGCTPFPIPKNGYEAMWNMQTFYRPAWYKFYASAYLVDSRGTPTMLATIDQWGNGQHWDPALKSSEFIVRELTEYTAPAAKAGGRELGLRPIRQDIQETKQFSYTPGLRRVRLAPELKYDTVISAYGGIYLCDELYAFDGRMDRFDFKLKGKQEVYVQYNVNKRVNSPMTVQAGKQFLNPDITRWELHRTWVVEGTLKAGARHSQSKKVFYIDEDTWMRLAYVAYDADNKLTKVMYGGLIADGAMQAFTWQDVIYDVTRGFYAFPAVFYGAEGVVKNEPFPANTFTAENVAGSAVR